MNFAGGIKDEQDASYVDCALRETEEEIGLPRDRIDVWGEGQLMYLRNGPAIMPVVGFVNDFDQNDLKINPDEVEKVFTVPLWDLCSSDCRRHTQFRTEKGYSLPVFTSGEERIWGITALITNLFLQSLLPKTVYRNRIRFVSKYKE